LHVLMLSAPESAGGPMPKIVPALSAGLAARGHAVEWSPWGSARGQERLLERMRARWTDALRARAAAVESGADIVVVHTGNDWRSVSRDWVLLRLLRSTKAVSMVVLHGSLPSAVEGRPMSLFARFTLATLRQAAVVGVLSSTELKAWRALLPETMIVQVKNPVPVNDVDAAFDLCNRTEPGPILFVGRLIEAKGCSRVISAYSGIAREIRPGLVIAGAGPERMPLEAQVGALGLDGEVSFVGEVGAPALEELYRSASMLVLPTVAPSEGLPMVLLEAAVNGVPVITAAYRGAVDYFKNERTALFVDPLDVPALSGAMRRLLEDREMASLMSARLRRLSMDFTPDVVAAEYEQVLQGALERVLDDTSANMRVTRAL